MWCVVVCDLETSRMRRSWSGLGYSATEKTNLNCSTCSGRHTAHHQELKNCNYSLWFYICLWLPAADSCRHPQTYIKPEAAITVFELLMISGVSLETCWTIKKHWNNKFYYTVASCWLFLWDIYYNGIVYKKTLWMNLLETHYKKKGKYYPRIAKLWFETLDWTVSVRCHRLSSNGLSD